MPSKLFDLTGKVAIVTGSSRGLGLASARGLAEHGAKVVISGRKSTPCDEAAAQIRAEGGQAIAQPCNIGRKDEIDALVGRAIDAWGRVDIVMANAAIHPWIGSALELEDATFDKFMQVNVLSSLWLVQGTFPGMIERGWGRFISVGSIVGRVGDAVTGTYGLTKAADMQMVRNLACEFGAKGITANCIAPGTFRTEMARTQWEDGAMVEWYCGRNPSARFGEPEEIAGLAVLLASPSGGYINGQTIHADGGHTISFR
ncbi:SDR family NAD(P)-dependent oxidoreductase [Tropicimonas isoalkanivorans]|uniref:NAD(P)-dependent dehydrogenase, short-chain alcohol dehydrogenase family n=1 Tax=Tropicimonas isoalkanivorans TaxID=441112 RepID=A0A1I1HYY2_9RHOB|nr:glucose 1-dehydrogenase [Tropicimonas isoalkanivorans]SFC29134.1 NAD(P)-dependent dehydrogenase, short-chain alcohol dehydrogenase family [Tropicimonas isoalkanivorans]